MILGFRNTKQQIARFFLIYLRGNHVNKCVDAACSTYAVPYLKKLFFEQLESITFHCRLGKDKDDRVIQRACPR